MQSLKSEEHDLNKGFIGLVNDANRLVSSLKEKEILDSELSIKIEQLIEEINCKRDVLNACEKDRNALRQMLESQRKRWKIDPESKYQQNMNDLLTNTGTCIENAATFEVVIEDEFISYGSALKDIVEVLVLSQLDEINSKNTGIVQINERIKNIINKCKDIIEKHEDEYNHKERMSESLKVYIGNEQPMFAPTLIL